MSVRDFASHPLIETFEKKKMYWIRKKYNVSKESQREKERKIIKFLLFCEELGINSIHNITQREYDLFMEKGLPANLSPETRRKYALAIKEFARKAFLFGVKVNPNRIKERARMRKLKVILDTIGISLSDLSKEQMDKILSIL